MAGAPSATLLVLAVYLAIQSAVLNVINTAVPDDYMDEVFHGPQAREYCRGAFSSWHPKITTFPGVYYLGAVYGWVRWLVQAGIGGGQGPTLEVACSTPFLRSLNVLLSGACLLAVAAVLRAQREQQQQHLDKGRPLQRAGARPKAEAVTQRRGRGGGASAGGRGGSWPELLYALALCCYPLHWFFAFLYYTDVGSLLFLLLCHLQATRRRYSSAALAGAAAVLMRQTNAVWAAFVLGEAVLDRIGMLLPQDTQIAQPAEADARGNSSKPAASAVERPLPQEQAHTSLISELVQALQRVWQQGPQLAASLWPLLLPPLAFVAFLVANGGSVVLGDKEAHTPVKHGAQLLYFGGWTAAMLWPQMASELLAAARAVRRRPVAALLVAGAAVAAAAGVAHVSTLAHPYLLADNRHYTFYLWRRLLARTPAMRYALAPAYAAAWALLLAALRRRVSRLWTAGLCACLAAQLLPAWLLELRYFTPGFFLIALRLAPRPPPYGTPRLQDTWQSLVLLATYAAINAATVWLFVKRPFTFGDGTVGRFMW